MSEDTQRIYHPGEALLREGEYGDEAFVLLRGQVTICRMLAGRRIDLAQIGPGQVIGEMALVAEKPRSATAIADVETLVEVISRKRFRTLLRDDTDLAMDLLKVLFERLREAQSSSREWEFGSVPESRVPEPPATTDSEETSDAPLPAGLTVLLTGLSVDAREVLPEGGLRITFFPYRIGRRSRDPLVENDYAIDDYQPYQVSRSHLVFIQDGDRIAVMDRGSYLGLEINGQRLGGEDGDEGAVYLDEDNRLWLGGEESSYEFRVQVLQPE
ncbi:MAG: cyclic nucleotide-binding domain-containing protein [Gammaproteobacteria bacterium]|nr:cyclic nucleotide-binding domain-containing protein [Gammaproteobacteria bacterium]MCP5136437.1 cyclic nucleotide-binding domain-containing protein [Gammaproteobacteria bacterium]